VTSKNGSGGTVEEPAGITDTKIVVNCICPKHSVAYIVKRFAYVLPPSRGGGIGYQYAFACSPKSVSIYPLNRYRLELSCSFDYNQIYSNIT
jgi:hypothetical protein